MTDRIKDKQKINREHEAFVARMDFFAAIGIAICAWQEVEVLLFETYGRFMRGADQGVVSAAFHSTLNFGIKLDATDAAAKAVIGDDPKNPLCQEWAELFIKINRRSKARNAIAHYHFYVEDQSRKYERMFFLAPNVFDTRSDWEFYGQHPKKLYYKNLEEIAASFVELQEKMKLFIDKLPKLPRRRATSRATKTD